MIIIMIYHVNKNNAYSICKYEIKILAPSPRAPRLSPSTPPTRKHLLILATRTLHENYNFY